MMLMISWPLEPPTAVMLVIWTSVDEVICAFFLREAQKYAVSTVVRVGCAQN